MANRANEYPDHVLCPLADEVIEDIDCIENQDVVDGMIKPDTMPIQYKEKLNWRQICQNCKYHEID